MDQLHQRILVMAEVVLELLVVVLRLAALAVQEL
jgi:hypothetical protein